jgi:hypothetical protein
MSIASPNHDSTIATSYLHPSKVYEDDNACIVLATNKSNFRPRTKHIFLQHHHFHQQIKKKFANHKSHNKVKLGRYLDKIFRRVEIPKAMHLLMGW